MYSALQVARLGLLKDQNGVPYTNIKTVIKFLDALGYSYTHPLGYNLTEEDLKTIQDYILTLDYSYKRNPKKWKTANQLLKYESRTRSIL